VDRVLIVSSSAKGGEILTDLLQDRDIRQLTVADSAAQARRYLKAEFFELIIINAPLSDETGKELAIQAAEDTVAGVIFLAKPDRTDFTGPWAEDCGIFQMPKPLSRGLFDQVLQLVRAYHRRLMGLQRENTQLQQKIQDIRLVDRAKCVLIQYLDMTEAQAHKYIERQAMDLRTSKREVAQGILRTYESENNR
jgi:response regulator NasT